VDVEDLLDEALIGVDRGVEEDERESGRDRCRGGQRKASQPPAE
jgi:hypothetical protein